MGIKIQNGQATESKEKEKEVKSALPSTKADKLKAALTVEKALNKEYGTVVLQKMGMRAGERLPSYPTGLVSFDEGLVNCGGVPKGRVIEIFGPEASGKTTISLHVIAEVQKGGGVAALIDAEHSLNPQHAVDIGVNLAELIISQPDYGEQALEIALALVEAGAIDVAVIDSVSALVPKAELDGDMGDASMGLQARLMSQACRKLTGLCNKNGVTLIFINQVREKIGVMFGNPETTSGGRALRFYASLRIKIRQMSKGDGGIIEENGIRIGQRSHLEAVKNKCGTPYSHTELVLMYGKGWDKRLDLVEYAEHIGVIQKVPGFYVFNEEKFRKSSLTEEPAFGILKLAVEKAIEAKREKALEEAKK